ncbi:hypothetical protein [Yunchengibacter salinarum]|uniref:hypothetical protein n=1 Tax=Yunchengibacter salinarum TaxID=3133399 RepID=UPI0035B5E36E
MHARLFRAAFASLSLIAVFFSPPLLAETPHPVDRAKAARLLEQARQTCLADDGALWGLQFCGPTLLIDPETRRALKADLTAIQPITEDGLEDVQWPDNMRLSNSTRYWNGVQYATLTWPVQARSEPGRVALVLHENYHRTQGVMHFRVGEDVRSEHLDSESGRVSLRLEARALEKAVSAEDLETRRHFARLALAFRHDRLGGRPVARQSERYLTLFEGLAEYSGNRLARSPSAFREYAAHRPTGIEGHSSFTRNFAYFTAPAWGWLLDQTGPDWRRSLTGEDGLADHYARRIGAQAPFADDAARQQGLAALDGATVKAEERQRASRIQARQQRYRDRFVDGPVLVMEANGFSMDPRTVTSLGQHGRVYEVLSISNDWGRFETENGALMGPRPPYVYAEAVTDESGALVLNNDQWTLSLKPGWTIVPHEKGFAIARQD